MSAEARDLVLTTAPFVRSSLTTPRIMLEVMAMAMLTLAFAVWNFGVGALLVVGAATGGALLCEWFFSARGSGLERSPLRDWSAALTGVLLGLTLPPSFPMWMAFLGGVAGIGLGKIIWGGLGQNLFNPALVGRAFLQAAFPTAITTWAKPVDGNIFTVAKSVFVAPLMSAQGVDVITGATPLGLQKFEHKGTELASLFFGNTGGSLGETSAALLIACGLYMAVRKIFDWRLPLSTLLSVAVCSGLLFAFGKGPSPDFMLLSGGLLFGAVFMVTDPVSTPTTPKGAWIFGLGVGFFVVLIRQFGGLPEGVMYAILLMNAVTPHINRFTRVRPFGG